MLEGSPKAASSKAKSRKSSDSKLSAGGDWLVERLETDFLLHVLVCSECGTPQEKKTLKVD